MHGITHISGKFQHLVELPVPAGGNVLAHQKL